jgi:uncharacterized protein (DUF433 family)
MIDVPWYEDAHGTLFVRNTTIPLEYVIHTFQQSNRPQDIVEQFDALEVADVYAVLAYYFANRERIEDYLVQQGEKAQAIRQRLEAQKPEMFTLEKKLRDLARQKTE